MTTTSLEAMATTTTEAGGGTAVTTPTPLPASLPFTGQNSIALLAVATMALARAFGVLSLSRGSATTRE